VDGGCRELSVPAAAACVRFTAVGLVGPCVLSFGVDMCAVDEIPGGCCLDALAVAAGGLGRLILWLLFEPVRK